MKLAAEQQVAAPREKVWEALNDPDILRASIPGCQSLERQADDTFAATLEVKVGPIGARFKGTVSLTDLTPPSGYTLILEGNGGIAGSVKGRATVRLRETAGGTLIRYEVDAELGGRLAQLGGPLIEATAKQLAAKFFARFGDLVSGTKPESASVSVSPAAAAPMAAPPASARAFPVAWMLAIVVAALTGFMMGRGNSGTEWAGVAIGLLLIVVAGAAFEYGRRSATPVVMLDNALLRRLMDGIKP